MLQKSTTKYISVAHNYLSISAQTFIITNEKVLRDANTAQWL